MNENPSPKRPLHRQLRMSQAAYHSVASMKERFPRDAAEYLTIARHLPAMMHTSGLVAALAFLKSKQSDSHRAYTHLYQHICSLIADFAGNSIGGAESSKDKIFESILAQDVLTYAHISRIAFIAADCLKRYSDILLGE